MENTDTIFKVIKQIQAHFGLKTDINICFVEGEQGFKPKEELIIFPPNLFEQDSIYVMYYVIHEMVHIILYEQGKDWGHTEEFRKYEEQVLKAYNIKPIYTNDTPYAKQLNYLGGERDE